MSQTSRPNRKPPPRHCRRLPRSRPNPSGGSWHPTVRARKSPKASDRRASPSRCSDHSDRPGCSAGRRAIRRPRLPSPRPCPRSNRRPSVRSVPRHRRAAPPTGFRSRSGRRPAHRPRPSHRIRQPLPRLRHRTASGPSPAATCSIARARTSRPASRARCRSRPRPGSAAAAEPRRSRVSALPDQRRRAPQVPRHATRPCRS